MTVRGQRMASAYTEAFALTIGKNEPKDTERRPNPSYAKWLLVIGDVV